MADKNKNSEDAWNPIGKIGCISAALPVAAGLLLISSPTAGLSAFAMLILARVALRRKLALQVD